jgi:FkbM family methyltransferase
MKMKNSKFIQFLISIIIILIIIYTLFNHNSNNYSNNNNIEIINDSFDEIWNEIIHVSNEQELINKQILFKTIKFMLKETEEDDLELIKFVKSLINVPDWKRKINLNNKNKKDFSQIGQSKYIDSLLNSKINGFFVEAGGYTGEDLSNSLFFELERNWTGILIEAVPSLYKQIIGKNRKSFTINCCISNKRPFIAKFQIAGPLSNRISLINEHFQNRVDKDIGTTKKTIIYVPCFSLYTILKAININKVDYFSLDVEGGELEVLKGINFNKIQIDTFSVEHNNYQDPRNQIKQFLEANNYSLIKDVGDGDSYFIKK